MKGLRLDFYFSKGFELAVGDVYSYIGSDTKYTVRKYSVSDLNSASNFNDAVFESFAPRKNEGVQPCGDDLPVNCYGAELVGFKSRNAYEWVWGVNGDSDGITVSSWKPNLQELIKMQNEADNQEVITNTQDIENAMYGSDMPVETPLEIALRKQREDIEQCLRKAGYFPAEGLGKVLQDAGKLPELSIDEDLFAL